MSQKFISIWDATFAVTGSVYLTPTYSSGPESGTGLYAAPGSLFFTAGQGAPARNVNYALQQLGNNSVAAAQHQGMVFASGADWPSSSISFVGPARMNQGFLVGMSTTAYNIHQPRLAAAQTLAGMGANKPLVMVDDGWRTMVFGASASLLTFIGPSSTVTSTTISGFTGLAARNVTTSTTTSKTMVIGTSGTAALAYSISSTAGGTVSTSVTVPAGTYSSSTLSVWGSTQVFLGTSTASGVCLFYSRAQGALVNNLLQSPDGVALNRVTPPSGTAAGVDTIADIAHDDVQGQFIMACYTSSASGVQMKFFTSLDTDGLTWISSSTPSGPASFPVIPNVAGGATVAFGICGGVWLVAIMSANPTNYVYGTGGGHNNLISAYYSLDYGRTWSLAPVDMLLASTGSATVRVVPSVDRFLIAHDSDIAMSGRVAVPELL